MSQSKPQLRWGVIATGWMSSMFVTDLIAPRLDAPADHFITAVGSSSISKANAFIDKVFGGSGKERPRAYACYEDVYHDPSVDIVYVGTPHVFHRQNCLDAIAAGKHILCEKPFAMNEREALQIVGAAKERGVFAMEAMWTRFSPLVKEIQQHLHQAKSIGCVRRAFVDYGSDVGYSALPANSRLKDTQLGAGALLDVGIYTLTYASLFMGNGKLGAEHPVPQIISSMDVVAGVDESDSILLVYGSGLERRTAVCTATLHVEGRQEIARIDGSEGTITIFSDISPSCPRSFTIRRKDEESITRELELPEGTFGFFHEADAVAADIAIGKMEDDVMPLSETLRILRLMDECRRQNGHVYAQDSE